MLVWTSLGTILRATGDTVTPMKVGIITNVTNVLLDYFLIFGFGWWDGLGILGTALEQFLRNFLAVICLLGRFKSLSWLYHFKKVDFGKTIRNWCI